MKGSELPRAELRLLMQACLFHEDWAADFLLQFLAAECLQLRRIRRHPVRGYCGLLPKACIRPVECENLPRQVAKRSPRRAC